MRIILLHFGLVNIAARGCGSHKLLGGGQFWSLFACLHKATLLRLHEVRGDPPVAVSVKRGKYLVSAAVEKFFYDAFTVCGSFRMFSIFWTLAILFSVFSSGLFFILPHFIFDF